MTEAPNPSKRRRRKIIVALVLLVLVSGVAWWYWPRGDARFVGKWHYFAVLPGESEVGRQPDGIFELRRGGVAFMEEQAGRLETTWRVEGQTFVTGFVGGAETFGRLDQAIFAAERLSGSFIDVYESRMRIVSITHDRIMMTDDETAYILIRIPE